MYSAASAGFGEPAIGRRPAAARAGSAGGSGTPAQARRQGQRQPVRPRFLGSRNRFHAGPRDRTTASNPPRIPEIRQYKAVRFTALLHSFFTHFTRLESGRSVGNRLHRGASRRLASSTDDGGGNHAFSRSRRRSAATTSGQDSERLPNLTRLALQTEKLQQNELLARLKQVDSISLALSERNRRCESVTIA